MALRAPFRVRDALTGHTTQVRIIALSPDPLQLDQRCLFTAHGFIPLAGSLLRLAAHTGRCRLRSLELFTRYNIRPRSAAHRCRTMSNHRERSW
jgi:hypothetical protein